MTDEPEEGGAITDEKAVEESGVVDYGAESEGIAAGDAQSCVSGEPRTGRSRAKRVLAFAILPALTLILALGAGFMKWQSDSAKDSGHTRAESVQAATESTIAMLSYQSDNVDKDLNAARDRLAEPFRDDYTKLITDVVIPGSKEKKISAIATVPAAALISAAPDKAVVLLFVDQSIVIGTDAPTSTSSTVRVTLEKDRDRWLISQFDPV